MILLFVQFCFTLRAVIFAQPTSCTAELGCLHGVLVDLELLRTEVEQLSNSLSSALLEIALLNTDISQLTAENANLQTRIATMTTDLARNASEIKTLKEELASLESGLTSNVSRIEDVESQMAALQPVQDALQDGLEWEVLTDFLQNEWTPHAPPTWEPRAVIDPFGVAHFFGLLEPGIRSDGVVVMVLPSRFHPARVVTVGVASRTPPAAVSIIEINTNGEVRFYYSSGTETYVCLSSVTYATNLTPG